MKRKTLGLGIASFLAWVGGLSLSPAAAYQYSVVINVGEIFISGDFSGAAWFKQTSGAAFSHCTNNPTAVYPLTPYVTKEGAQAILSVLLTARAANTPVRVWYDVDAQGRCVYDAVTLEVT